MATTTPRTRRGLSTIVAGVFGAVYLLVGLLGFTVSGGHAAAGPMGGMLLGIFMVNTLHNVVHVVIGLLLLAAARTERTAAVADAGVGIVYALVFVYGLVVPASSAANVVALNSADNVLHILSALLLGGVGLSGLRRRSTAGPDAARA